MDLHSRLERFGGPVESASAEDIAADLGRGRSAVRRRRTVQATAGSAFAVAAIVAAVAFVGGTPGTDGVPNRAPAVAQAPTGSSAATEVAPGGLTLVDYRGPQPKDFTIDKVPDGYFVQNDDFTGLTIAPDRFKNPGPDVNPSTEPMYDPRVLTGKIGVYLERKDYRGELSGEKLTVGDYQAVLHTIGTTQQLLMAVAPEVYATIQVDVPLSRDQVLALGAGLHVHQEAINKTAAAEGIIKK
ncbi:hypothetical protein GCM10010435_90350 [Winogradskya consettensis]|uniref:Uncharacterized protein n=1 Tax=Winogradskya consettensis TaxID=113560 RepID=A0A919VWL6_9ACTN|nr:hypothetical protein [Actinoplanes consettensis]GIM77740.1 hypothetical protein Aco04nite_56840 [Actinoplanes consettensis]